VAILQHEQLSQPLFAGISVAGENGSLEQRYAGTDLVGVLRAKTGSLNSVTALTGVVEDADPPLTFAYVANVSAPGRIDPEAVSRQEGLASLLVSWPRVPDLATLGPHPLVAEPENR
jgi:D-alanyl-D-alanine carboxypeptidase/D-alanyl-D-alanine-endopeptidase (penicillin-binding protein 4)